MKLPFASYCRASLRKRGAETIEVAIALPLVLLVIFAGCEYGWALLRTLQTDHAAREGARIAALHGISAIEVQQRVQSTLDDAGIAGATVVLEPSDPSSVPVGTPISVRVKVPYRQNKLLGLASFMPLPEELTAHASMVKEPDP
jgi:hypothetical protein